MYKCNVHIVITTVNFGKFPLQKFLCNLSFFIHLNAIAITYFSMIVYTCEITEPIYGYFPQHPITTLHASDDSKIVKSWKHYLYFILRAFYIASEAVNQSLFPEIIFPPGFLHVTLY